MQRVFKKTLHPLAPWDQTRPPLGARGAESRQAPAAVCLEPCRCPLFVTAGAGEPEWHE